jgi:hypothetical protein
MRSLSDVSFGTSAAGTSRWGGPQAARAPEARSAPEKTTAERMVAFDMAGRLVTVAVNIEAILQRSRTPRVVAEWHVAC